MKSETLHIRICPRCGARYAKDTRPFKGRRQNAYLPDCGTREALASMGVSREEQEEIIETIHRSNR